MFKNIFLTSFIGLGLISCGSDEAVSAELGGLATANERVYTMYDGQAFQRDEYCDLGTKLVLKPKGLTLIASLENFSKGSHCEYEAAPSPRTYTLEMYGDDCGTIGFQSKEVDERGEPLYKLLDHTGRYCADRRAHLIETEELQNGYVQLMYNAAL